MKDKVITVSAEFVQKMLANTKPECIGEQTSLIDAFLGNSNDAFHEFSKNAMELFRKSGHGKSECLDFLKELIGRCSDPIDKHGQKSNIQKMLENQDPGLN